MSNETMEVNERGEKHTQVLLQDPIQQQLGSPKELSHQESYSRRCFPL